MFENEALRNSLQWAFPQAYYSTYAITVAYFVSAGFTERSHRAVIAKYGHLAIEGKYPRQIGFVLEGPPTNYQHHNLSPACLRGSLHFDPANSGIVDAQIMQFLNGTRDDDLHEKKRDMKFKTKDGRPKHGFNKQDWIRTSDKFGPTSLLSLLYRKRIKANYRDIETFLAKNLDPAAAFDSLISVVDCTNCVHEALIRKLVGSEFYEALVSRTDAQSHSFLHNRLTSIRSAAP
jgi:hypothetical protein